jgi:hypothetical protein
MEWIAGLNRLMTSFTTEFGQLDAEQLNQKPNANAWSIGQVIDHIITVNETYFPIVEAIRAGGYTTPWTGKVPFLVNWFGDFILKGVEPTRQKKIETFPVWEPAKSEVRADIVQHFAEHQSQLAEWMANCKDLVEAGTVISSPANRFIVYKIGRAFDIIVAHEERHLNQAREVKNFF